MDGSLLALALAPRAAGPAEYRAEMTIGNTARVVGVNARMDGLAVRGLFLAADGANPPAAIRHPRSLPLRIAKRVGTFTIANGQTTFAADANARVTSDGKPVTTVTLGRGGAASITTDGVVISAIRRGDKVGLRMWDPDSSNRTGFKGLKYFPLSSAYRLRAKYTAYDKLKPVPVPNVLGQVVTMDSPGFVEFAINGKSYRLEPVYETSRHEDLFFIFKDLTSKKETYEAGRFLHTPLPRDGVVDLDFNRAYNPPCAFTEFATCPLPIKENQLNVRIPAGELRFHLPTAR